MGTPPALQTFAGWEASNRGDEASVAQAYVNRLLQAWVRADAVEAGTTVDHKIAKGSLAGSMGKVDALIEATRATGAGSSPPSQGWSCSPMSWIY